MVCVQVIQRPWIGVVLLQDPISTICSCLQRRLLFLDVVESRPFDDRVALATMLQRVHHVEVKEEAWMQQRLDLLRILQEPAVNPKENQQVAAVVEPPVLLEEEEQEHVDGAEPEEDTERQRQVGDLVEVVVGTRNNNSSNPNRILGCKTHGEEEVADKRRRRRQQQKE
jgi:hypothetical protein